MGYDISKLEISKNMMEEINNAVNKNRRNIIVTGLTGSGRNTMLHYLADMCQHNKHIVNDIIFNIDKKAIEERVFMDSIYSLSGLKTSLVVFEFSDHADYLEEIMTNYSGIYINFMITDDTRLLKEIMGRSNMRYLNPLILEMERVGSNTRYAVLKEYNTGEVLCESTVGTRSTFALGGD